MQTLRIGDKVIGKNQPIYFIAEIGINHNGDMQIAKKLMDSAFATGWDCVKYQKRTPDICVPEHQKSILRSTPWGEMTYLDYRYKVEFEKAEYDFIDDYCKQKPLHWTASIWDINSLEFLLQYDVPFIKIPSAKITDEEIVSACAQSGKPIFFSSGMSTLEELDTAVEQVAKHTSNYVLFHTNSSYPTKPEELNLRVIETLAQRYGCLIGYSGHEYGLEPSVIAATLGVCVIERHVTVDHNMWGSDQFASLEIDGMQKLRRRIGSVLVALGDGVKRVTGAEAEARKKLRG